MIVIYVAPLVAIAGLLIYAFAANPKAIEVGRLMFFAGLFVTLLMFEGAHPLRLP